MKTIIASQGQSIFDLAFICYGSYDVLKLMQENPFITDLTYTDFAGKTIKYTPTNNNATFANGLSSRVVNTGNLIEKGTSNIVWDGVFDIWDGLNDLAY